MELREENILTTAKKMLKEAAAERSGGVARRTHGRISQNMRAQWRARISQMIKRTPVYSHRS
jgi:hypothetical protein